jgi:phosphatidylserine decarboxylase
VADRAAGVPFAKEGFPFIGAAAAITLIAWWLNWLPLAVVGAMLTLFVSWFFRNPRRRVPQGPGLVVAPGDGVVLAVEEEFEPRYLKDRAVRISIFLNVFDVHINRIPCEGIVENVQYQPGLFLVASKPHATVKNEQNAVMIKTVEGAKVLCVQVAGLIARRIVCWVNPKDRAVRGERYGLIRFGSRMDTYLPVGTAIRIAVGNRVTGGETILGELR